MADQVKLFGTGYSPFSRRVEMALKLKGVEYEYIEEDLYNKSALFLEYNPIHKKVPVLVHNGKPIAESLIILEYIDETWKNNPIIPQAPHDRALTRFWASFIDEKIMSLSWIAKLNGNGEEAAKEIHEVIKLLENQLGGKDLFGGDSIGYLDIVGTTVAFWFPAFGQALGHELLGAERFPKLYRWIEKLGSVEVVAQCLPGDDLVEKLKMRLATFAAASQ